MKTYSEKLRDPRWQRKRLEIMERDNFKCQDCGSETETLNVHHYAYSREPWDAKSSDLETVCEICHKEIEDFKKEIARATRYPRSRLELRRLMKMQGHSSPFLNESSEGVDIMPIYRHKKDNRFLIYLWRKSAESPFSESLDQVLESIPQIKSHVQSFKKV